MYLGEQPLFKNGACCLSSINLSEFVKNPYTAKAGFDYYEFCKCVGIGVRYLDNIVDINAPRHPLQAQRDNSIKWRNIGLGVFGYGSMLMKLGIKYGSDQAREVTDRIFRQMFRKGVLSSSELAKEKGSFPGYSDKVWESGIIQNAFTEVEINDLKKNGLRNCSLISIAPTGLA